MRSEIVMRRLAAPVLLLCCGGPLAWCDGVGRGHAGRLVGARGGALFRGNKDNSKASEAGNDSKPPELEGNCGGLGAGLSGEDSFDVNCDVDRGLKGSELSRTSRLGALEVCKKWEYSCPNET